MLHIDEDVDDSRDVLAEIRNGLRPDELLAALQLRDVGISTSDF